MSYPSPEQPQNFGHPQGYGQAQNYGHAQSPSLGFVEALRLAWARKLEFTGRSRRSEYWWLALGVSIVSLVIYFAALILVGIGSSVGHGAQVLTGLIAGVVYLALLVLSIVVALPVLVRRLHDTDKSGWWVLLSFVPFGSLVLLVFAVLDSTPGPNRFGASPKEIPSGYGPS